MPASTPQPNVNRVMLDAMQALTDQIKKLNVYYEKLDNKAAQSQAGSAPDRSAEEMQVRSGRSPLPFGGHDISMYDQERFDHPGAYVGTMSLGDTAKLFKTKLGQQEGPRQIRRTLAEFAPSGVISESASVPGAGTASTRRLGGIPLGRNNGGRATRPGASTGGMSDEQALSWALLGEHGGPAFVRNKALEAYGLQRSIGWAQNMAGQLNQTDAEGKLTSWVGKVPGVNAESMGAVSGALNIAANHPLATYAAYKVGQGALHAAKGGLGNLWNWQEMGAQLGGAVSPERSVFGLRNLLLSPFLSGSTSIGMGAAVDKQALQGRVPGMGFGTGLTKQQAGETIQNITSQGFGANETKWGKGDIWTMANQVYRPLMQKMPGLSAEDIGQFTPYLRNAGMSTKELAGALGALNDQAATTHETVGQLSGSFAEFSKQVEGMGSSPGGALNAANQFTSSTGLDPRFLGTLMQNPMFQGLAMSKYGVLPSGLGDLGGGALTNNASSMIQMLQGATAGLNKNIVDPKTGMTMERGSQRQADQIAQMSGLPVPVVQKLMQDKQAIASRSNMAQMGNEWQIMYQNQAQYNKGGKLTAGQQAYDQKWWDSHVANNNLTNTGVSEGDMKRLSKEPFDQRMTHLNALLAKGSKKDAINQVQTGPHVQIVLSGQAAKMFGLKSDSTDKQAANAGGTSLNVPVNSIQGPGQSNGGLAGTLANAFGFGGA